MNLLDKAGILAGFPWTPHQGAYRRARLDQAYFPFWFTMDTWL
jgi:hypothetical protein